MKIIIMVITSSAFLCHFLSFWDRGWPIYRFLFHLLLSTPMRVPLPLLLFPAAIIFKVRLLIFYLFIVFVVHCGCNARQECPIARHSSPHYLCSPQIILWQMYIYFENSQLIINEIKRICNIRLNFSLRIFLTRLYPPLYSNEAVVKCETKL